MADKVCDLFMVEMNFLQSAIHVIPNSAKKNISEHIENQFIEEIF